MILSKSGWRAGIGLCAAMLFSGMAFAQSEAVLIKRASQLRDAPGEASKTLAPLAVQTSLTRLGERQGPWVKVRMADGTQGWVHMFDITSPASASTGNAGTNALRGITSFFNKGSTQASAGLPTSTVGIRGLGAEDIANSQPNLTAVTLLDTARMDAVQALQFAGTASLSARQIAPLPVPAPPPRAASPSTPDGGNNSNNQFQGGG
ncbi:MAG: SH3 domain-containing protein [Pseudomonadota bacterium]